LHREKYTIKHSCRLYFDRGQRCGTLSANRRWKNAIWWCNMRATIFNV